MRRIAIVGVAVAVATAFGAWLYLRADRADTSVAAALAERAQLGAGTVVDFADVAPFAWDRVYIFGPYTSPEHIDACLGFHWPAVSRSSINSSKGRNLVVLSGASKWCVGSSSRVRSSCFTLQTAKAILGRKRDFILWAPQIRGWNW